MASSEKLWPMGEQTRGKHLVLRKYLDAWLPIRGRYNGRILFIDGFAGPGVYKDGEKGSPILALDAHMQHAHKGVIKAEVKYIFIEKNKARAEHLQALINDLKPDLPENCVVEDVITGKFDETMTETLNVLDRQAKTMAPAFVMIDPFGVSDTPMTVIERILRNSESEVYVSFMYEALNRFKETPEFEAHLDKLFGCGDWREAHEITDGNERKEFLHNLYDRQLRSCGAVNVLRFELYREKRHIYTLFFATKSNKGSDEMKEAMWKVAPDGGFCFYGSHQLALGIAEPDFAPLKRQIVENFTGRDWVFIDEVIDFVASDKTDYHTGQLKKPVLVPMEDAGELEVDPNTRKRKRTYPPGTRIRFKAAGK